MKTTDLFTSNRRASRLNESLERVFGRRINLEGFDLAQLEDARNKLRTQISQVRSESGFNETIENEALTQAQWMLDAINSEIAEREEFAVGVKERVSMSDIDIMFNDWINSEYAPNKDLAGDDNAVMQLAAEFLQGQVSENELTDVAEILTKMYHGEDIDDEGGETDDDYALASAGFGSDEDYESIQREDRVDEKAVSKAQQRAAGIALAAKRKGETPPGKGAAAEMAKMTTKELEKFAGTKHKNLPAKKDESVDQGDEMTRVTEGEIQQAQSIVTAKTMVDRVGRWIEELSGMENDTLLQLGDQIRDEMGQEQAKSFISAVAPAIQQALENLKTTRETLATGVRTLTGEQQPAEMLGAEPGAEGEVAPAAPDEMNMPAEEPAADEFAAAEPAAGGLEDAGREQRESIEYQNRLLRVLAG